MSFEYPQRTAERHSVPYTTLVPDIISEFNASADKNDQPGGSIPIDVLNDAVIEVSNRAITLTPSQLFAINALLACSGIASATEMQELAGSTARHLLNPAPTLFNLKQQLDKTTGHEIIGVLAKKSDTWFAINPNVQFVDARSEQNSTSVSHEEKHPYAEDTFRNYTMRKTSIRQMVALFGDHPHIEKTLAAFHKPRGKKRVSSDSTGDYILQLKQYPHVDHAQQAQLFRCIDAGLKAYLELPDIADASPQDYAAMIDAVAARQVLFTTNTGLSIASAKHFSKRTSVPLIDLIQAANIGLDEAIYRFNVEEGNAFSTYAVHWIQQGVSRAIANESRLIRMPVHMTETLAKLKRAHAEFVNELGRDPTHQELACLPEINLPHETVTLIMQMGGQNIWSLNFQSGEDGSSLELGDMIQDAPPREFEEALFDRMEIEDLFKNPRLSDVQKVILAARFGLANLLPRTIAFNGPKGAIALSALVDHCTAIPTLEEIADKTGYSSSRIGQIEQQALHVAKEILQAQNA